LRSFIAIELPEAVKSALSEFQQELKKCGADVRWVKPESVHLTLKFLGNISEKDVDRIIKSLEGTCRKYTAFNLEISGAGVFPNKKSPRVLWIGVTVNGAFAKLQQEIEDAMASMGFEKENRKFVPHLTLGRCRSSIGKEALLEKIELHKDNTFGVIDVKNVSFMKSELSPVGAKHTRVAEIALGKQI
jgi:RNA 2',3'-cyclic 3'-phosphodiesterase